MPNSGNSIHVLTVAYSQESHIDVNGVLWVPEISGLIFRGTPLTVALRHGNHTVLDTLFQLVANIDLPHNRVPTYPLDLISAEDRDSVMEIVRLHAKPSWSSSATDERFEEMRVKPHCE